MARATAACVVLAVVVIVAMAGAPRASAQHCDMGDLQAVCYGPINSGATPDARCCGELKDQLLCFCRDPGYVGYLQRPNIVKALGSCRIPPPECEP